MNHLNIGCDPPEVLRLEGFTFKIPHVLKGVKNMQ